MNWNLWLRQTVTVIQVELKRYILGRRWLGVYCAALAPVVLLTLNYFFNHPRNFPSIEQFSTIYALFYQTYMLRLAVFFSCGMVFTQLFRGEVLEKTLHFYLLAPVRREILILGKFLAGVIATGTIFGLSTLLTHVLIYMKRPGWSEFFTEGDGISNMAYYFLATVMACVAYGGLFLLIGLLFKNPIGPNILLAGWEAFYFILPTTLQKLTVMHYLQSLLPVGIDLGPLAVVVDPTPAFLGIPALLIMAGIFVWISGQVMRRVQVTYSTD